jgi:hypothetical protein
VSFARLWLFLGVGLPVLAPMSTVDLTYHLRAGAEIIATRSIPVVDSWTFTAAGQPWVDQQWGAQVVLAGARAAGSWTGLVLLRALLTGAIFGCLVVIGRRRGLDARTIALLVLAAFIVAAPALALRPQLLGMACFAVILVLVAGRRERRRALWLAPVVVLVWANVHGSFVLGPLALGLAWLEDRHDGAPAARHTLVLAAASVIAACVTPSGPLVWQYAAGLATNPEVTARISEWQPTTVRDPSGLVFVGSLAAVAAGLARRGRATPWPTLLWLAAFALIGVYAQRGIAWWPLAAAAAMAGTVLTASGAREIHGLPIARRLNAAVAAALVAVGVALLPAWRPIDPGTGAPPGVLTDAPPGITAALRAIAGPGDRILNPQPWGSWFEYALPEARVAVDSRIEFFPPEVWREHEAIYAGADGWQAILERWAPTIIVGELDAAFVRRLRAVGWSEVARDSDGVVLVRRP